MSVKHVPKVCHTRAYHDLAHDSPALIRIVSPDHKSSCHAVLSEEG